MRKKEKPKIAAWLLANVHVQQQLEAHETNTADVRSPLTIVLHSLCIQFQTNDNKDVDDNGIRAPPTCSAHTSEYGCWPEK